MSPGRLEPQQGKTSEDSEPVTKRIPEDKTRPNGKGVSTDSSVCACTHAYVCLGILLMTTFFLLDSFFYFALFGLDVTLLNLGGCKILKGRL